MNLDLYIVTDEALSNGLSHTEIARQALLGGADAIQLRDKTRPARELYGAASEIRALPEQAKALFIVNDRIDIALAAGADGVHLGQDDLPLPAARRIAPEGFLIGISAGSVGEALRAERDGADYIALSPVFTTGSKPDAGPGSGLAVLRNIRSAVSLPIVGIGGIHRGNVREVVLAGADGIAVISAVVSQPDIAAAAREMKSLIHQAKRDRDSPE